MRNETQTHGETNRIVTIFALIAWTLFGQLGGAFAPGTTQDVLWALSSTGMVVASPLLVFRFARAGNDVVAAGHAVLAIAAMVLWAGGPISTASGHVSFNAAMIFYPSALVLIGAAPGHPLVARVLGALAAVPFGYHATRCLLGSPPSPEDPLGLAVSIGGYVLMTAAVIGWIVGLVRVGRTSTASAPVHAAAAPAGA